MRNFKHAAAVAAIIGFGLAGLANADVVDLTFGSNTVAQWDFSSDLDVTHLGTNVSSGSGLTWTIDPDNSGHSGNAAPYTDGRDYVNNGNKPLSDNNPTPDSSGRAYARYFRDIETDAYEFSLTIEDGYQLNLQDVAFDIGFRQAGADEISVVYATTSDFTDQVIIGGGGAGMGNRETDADAGFRTDEADTAMGYADDGNFNVLRPGKGDFSWNRYVNGDLEGTEGQGLTDTLYFRIYIGGAEGESLGDNNIYLDNLTVRGDVVVPEPATMVMLGLGGLAALLRRRKA